MTLSPKFPVILAACAGLLLCGVLAQTATRTGPADHAAHSPPAPASHSAHSAAPTAPAKTTSAGQLPLTVQGATVAAVPPSIKDTSAFMTLTNSSAQAVKLVGVSSPLAAHGMLMKTVKRNGMLGMVMTPMLVVPARGKLTLRNDGDHLMLMGLKRPLKVGESVKLTLKAADGRTLTVNATVRKP